MIARTLRALFLLCVLLGGVVRADEYAAPAVAKPATADPKPDKDGFVPVSPDEQLAIGETIPATRLVAGAYGFILAAICVWIFSVASRARRVEAELQALRKKIER